VAPRGELNWEREHSKGTSCPLLPTTPTPLLTTASAHAPKFPPPPPTTKEEENQIKEIRKSNKENKENKIKKIKKIK